MELEQNLSEILSLLNQHVIKTNAHFVCMYTKQKKI